MDHISHSDEDSIDLESGETGNETVESQSVDLVPGEDKPGLSFHGKLCDGFVKGSDVVSYNKNSENLKCLINQKVEVNESVKLPGKDRRKSTSIKKPHKGSKPPRPPRASSLDAADQKLIKEIAELAVMRRARTERMRALKKMKAAKAPPSSNGSIFAMLFTALCSIVIIFQGISSHSSSAVKFHSSMDSTQVAWEKLNLVRENWNSSYNTSGIGCFSQLGQVSGSIPQSAGLTAEAP